MADETDAGSEQETAPEKSAAPKKRAASAATKKRVSPSGGARTRTKASSSRPNAVSAARAAKEQLGELVGKESETVIGVQRTDDGWEVDLEVVETRRIPDTTDVLAIYRVQLDTAGDVEGYQRVERYIRGKAEGGVTGG